MKHIAEQFLFNLKSDFAVGDKVIVTPREWNDFQQFYGVVQNKTLDGRHLRVSSMDGEQHFEGVVLASQCRLATT